MAAESDRRDWYYVGFATTARDAGASQRHEECTTDHGTFSWEERKKVRLVGVAGEGVLPTR
jgi:hypothetical protein